MRSGRMLPLPGALPQDKLPIDLLSSTVGSVSSFSMVGRGSMVSRAEVTTMCSLECSSMKSCTHLTICLLLSVITSLLMDVKLAVLMPSYIPLYCLLLLQSGCHHWGVTRIHWLFVLLSAAFYTTLSVWRVFSLSECLHPASTVTVFLNSHIWMVPFIRGRAVLLVCRQILLGTWQILKLSLNTASHSIKLILWLRCAEESQQVLCSHVTWLNHFSPWLQTPLHGTPCQKV